MRNPTTATRTRGGAALVAPVIAAFAILTAAGAGPAAADNECRIQYSYWTSGGRYSTAYEYIDEGQKLSIHQGSARHVRNLQEAKVRIRRTGFGSTVDLNQNQNDPPAGVYQPGVILQEAECLAGNDAPSPALIQQIAQQLFDAIANSPPMTAVQNVVSQVPAWTQQASQHAQRSSVDYWASCPSAPAQAAYDDLKSKRASLQTAINQAQDLKNTADDALATCQSQTNGDPICSTTYNTLALNAKISTLTTARYAVDAAISAMRGLKCIQGCSDTLDIQLPQVQVSSGGFWTVENRISVCTAGNSGSVDWDVSQLPQNPGGVLQFNPPTCRRTTTYSMCTNFDLRALAAELQRLRIVAPSVGITNVDVPSRSVRVLNGFARARCQEQLRICDPGGSVEISVNQGRSLFDGGVSCNSYLNTGLCKNPAFGLQPTYGSYEVPDLTRVRVTVDGRRGSLEVDLSAPNFQRLCRGADDFRIPKPPNVNVSMATRNVPFICTQPNYVDLVANP